MGLLRRMLWGGVLGPPGEEARIFPKYKYQPEEVPSCTFGSVVVVVVVVVYE